MEGLYVVVKMRQIALVCPSSVTVIQVEYKRMYSREFNKNARQYQDRPHIVIIRGGVLMNDILLSPRICLAVA